MNQPSGRDLRLYISGALFGAFLLIILLDFLRGSSSSRPVVVYELPDRGPAAEGEED